MNWMQNATLACVICLCCFPKPCFSYTYWLDLFLLKWHFAMTHATLRKSKYYLYILNIIFCYFESCSRTNGKISFTMNINSILGHWRCIERPMYACSWRFLTIHIVSSSFEWIYPWWKCLFCLWLVCAFVSIIDKLKKLIAYK